MGGPVLTRSHRQGVAGGCCQVLISGASGEQCPLTLARVTPAIGVVGGLLFALDGDVLLPVLSLVLDGPLLGPLDEELWAHIRPEDGMETSLDA